MISFEISPPAKADLDSIRTYYSVELDNLELSERILTELHNAFRRISRTPEIGHFRTDLAPKPFRFWKVNSYLIVYEISDVVKIARVIHAARDFPHLELEFES
jgi:plasmid stabilization system protein ParE